MSGIVTNEPIPHICVMLRCVLVAVALAAGWPAPAPACGCGAVVSADPAASGRAGDEWSIVRFDGSVESILMRLRLGVPLERAALVLPVRPGATVDLGDDKEFSRVAALTAPRVERRSRFHLGFGGGGGGGDTAGAPGAGGGVDMLGGRDLGPLRVVTLRSGSASALEDWLRAHRFPLPDGLAEGTQSYLDDGWDVVVARLRAAADGETLATLQPLEIRFPAQQVVYPLRLSRMAAGGSTARVDVFAPMPLASDGELLFAGRAEGSFLTSYRFRVTPSSPDRDPVFIQSDATPFRQTVVRYRGRLPRRLPARRRRGAGADRRRAPVARGRSDPA